MTRTFALILGCSILSSCSGGPANDRNACTSETVGADLGAKIVTLTLLVPDHFMTGAEISNGGITTLGPNCDFALNAFFSNETADYVIRTAADYPLKHREAFRVVEAEMLIWRFSDGSGEARFFVKSIIAIGPVQTLPPWLDAPTDR